MNETKHLAKVAINKSLLKEYSNSNNERIVYLDNGSEFQIQLFNPYPYVIGVKLEFNNSALGNSGYLVLKPGERVWLERYLDDNKKLLFSTYEVDGSDSDVKDAIRDNGKLCIKFFKEHVDYSNNIMWTYPKSIPDTTIYYDYNGSCTCTQQNALSAAVGATKHFTTNTSLCGVYTPSTSDNISSVNYTYFTNTIETGRIERGSHSEQKFNSIDISFEYWAFSTETIWLYPKSRKPVLASDLAKKYCPNCGRKVKDKFKFCPFCGENL